MDRMRACGVCDPGSIPGEGTNIIYLQPKLLILHMKLLRKYIF